MPVITRILGYMKPTIFRLGGVPYEGWGQLKTIYELKSTKYRIPKPQHVSDNL